MTPKEKAEELLDRMLGIAYQHDCTGNEYLVAKDCALIAVDEIIEAIDWHDFETPNKELQYWQEVKQEIEKL